METYELSIPGLDPETVEALVAEQQEHLQRIAQIGQRNPGTWSYTLNDEEQRHRRLLESIFLDAQKRSQRRVGHGEQTPSA